MIWIYRLLYLPTLLLALPYYLCRMWRRGGYRKSFQHRFGRLEQLKPVPEGKVRFWLQAVSVGEVLAVGPLIEILRQDPSIEIVLTTTTSTGYAEARKRYTGKVLSLGIFPLDFWLFSRCAWKRVQPSAILLTEGELWPEHLHRAQRSQVPAFLINARLSDRSFNRYKKVTWLAARILQKFERIYAASILDQSRFRELGGSPDRVSLSGSIKFDVPVAARLATPDREALRHSLGFGPTDGPPPFVIVGASTWPGEEVALLETQRLLLEAGIDCRLLLVPRHAERGNELAQILGKQELPWIQLSTHAANKSQIAIYLADTTGELAQLMQAADLAFIGKSLPPHNGGQTPIEAAGLGLPLLMGPNMSNFKEVARSLIDAGAAQMVEDPNCLSKTVLQLQPDQPARDAMARAGTQWHAANRGSSQRIAASLQDHFRSLRRPDNEQNA
ncbi:MAG: 3-deoxy-D-manno-octulosonic acid transferase [Puniceicoccaceae bacterium]|nr:MAG: 3-deoxy-D-manno-octulosonic acid transferase [Puniceicoccaceae bacterium]